MVSADKTPKSTGSSMASYRFDRIVSALSTYTAAIQYSNDIECRVLSDMLTDALKSALDQPFCDERTAKLAQAVRQLQAIIAEYRATPPWQR